RRRSALEKSDDDLRAARAKPEGAAEATWRRFAAPEWRVLRKGHVLTEGADAMALAAHDPAQLGSGPRRGLDVAGSGDLAYTIGGDAECKACGSYYRIWGWQDDGWRL